MRTIKDISSEALKKMVEFLYSGEIFVESEETAIDLYKAVDKYDIDGLKATSSSVLMHVDTQNVLIIVKLADLYRDESLKDCCYLHCPELCRVKSSELWQGFLNDDKTLATEILSCVAKSEMSRA